MERTIDISIDCIDEFTIEGDDSSDDDRILNITAVSSTGKLTCSSVKIIGAAAHPLQKTRLIVKNAAEIMTKGSCE